MTSPFEAGPDFESESVEGADRRAPGREGYGARSAGPGENASGDEKKLGAKEIQGSAHHAENGARTSKGDRREAEPRHPLAFFLCLLPGSLAGTQLAGLLFFLNPHLPFSESTVSQGILFFSSILGLATAPFLLWSTRGRPRHLRRWLPLAITFVLVVSALGFWTHAYFFGYYLPPGINTRLLKAAISISFAALIGFYTAVLHQARRRPFGRRSLALYALLSLLAVYVVVERREAYRPRLEPTRTTTFGSSARPLLCVVGIESTTLDVILPLSEQGRLPFFARLLEEGVQGRLDSLEPMVPDALWTSLATGKYPHRHGVTGPEIFDAYFLSPGTPRRYLNLLPVGFGALGLFTHRRPVASTDLRTSTLWEILDRLGLSNTVVGWPVTDPPTPDSGVIVADTFFEPERAHPRLASSDELAQRALFFRTPVAELGPERRARFGESPPVAVLEALARDLWRQDLSFFLLDREPPTDALFLHLDGLGTLSELYFGGYSAVQFRGSQNPESVEAARLLTAYYEQLDQFLGQLWESIREPKLMIVVSTHGVDEGRGIGEAMRLLTRRPATRGYVAGAPDGVFLMLGDGARAGSTVLDADLVDLVPTALYGLGFPVARDLDGTVLVDAFDPAYMARRPLSFVPSYETFATQLETSRENEANP